MQIGLRIIRKQDVLGRASVVLQPFDIESGDSFDSSILYGSLSLSYEDGVAVVSMKIFPARIDQVGG